MHREANAPANAPNFNGMELQGFPMVPNGSQLFPGARPKLGSSSATCAEFVFKKPEINFEVRLPFREGLAGKACLAIMPKKLNLVATGQARLEDERHATFFILTVYLSYFKHSTAEMSQIIQIHFIKY